MKETDGLKRYLRTKALNYLYSIKKLSVEDARDISIIMTDDFMSQKRELNAPETIDAFREYMIANAQSYILDWFVIL